VQEEDVGAERTGIFLGDGDLDLAPGRQVKRNQDGPRPRLVGHVFGDVAEMLTLDKSIDSPVGQSPRGFAPTCIHSIHCVCPTFFTVVPAHMVSVGRDTILGFDLEAGSRQSDPQGAREYIRGAVVELRLRICATTSAANRGFWHTRSLVGPRSSRDRQASVGAPGRVSLGWGCARLLVWDESSARPLIAPVGRNSYVRQP
jgi:hypothetical protein